MSHHDLEAKSCPAHNFVIWSRILKLFHRNDHYKKLLRRRVASKIWVATLKVKITAWPCSKIVSGPLPCYLKSDFTTIWQKWSPYWDDLSRTTFGLLPEGQGHSMTLRQNRVWPITLLFEVGFYISQKWSRYWNDMSRNILVATLKVKVTAWTCSKIRSGP